MFTNTREQKEPYTGKVQDWDFRLETELVYLRAGPHDIIKHFRDPERFPRTLQFFPRLGDFSRDLAKNLQGPAIFFYITFVQLVGLLLLLLLVFFSGVLLDFCFLGLQNRASAEKERLRRF
eukprot:g41936.t1